MSKPTGPLKDFRILDLTTVLFGPFGTQTLGDWGAEIIKIESLTGDTWRTSGQFRNRGMSGQFMAANRISVAWHLISSTLEAMRCCDG